MHETVPTVQIETENGPVVINKADYDSKVHKLVDVKFDRQVAVEYLKEKGVQFAGNAKNTDLEKLVEETKKAEEMLDKMTGE